MKELDILCCCFAYWDMCYYSNILLKISFLNVFGTPCSYVIFNYVIVRAAMLEYNRANHAKKMESKSRKKLLFGGYFSSLKSSAEKGRGIWRN